MVCQDLAGGLDLGDEGESSVNFDAVFYDNPKKFKVQEKERDFNEYQSWRDPPAFYIGGWRNKLKTECSSAKRFKQTLRTAMLLLSGDDNVGDSKDSLKFCVFDTKEIASNVQDLPKQLVEEVTSDNTCLYKMPNHLVTTVESAIKYGPKVTVGSDGTVAVTAAEGTTFANAKTTIKGLDKEIIQSQQE